MESFSEQKEKSKSEILMFYNVENLFYPIDHREVKEKNKFIGLKSWNKARYLEKLYKIGDVLEQIKFQHGSYPMLMGVSEVQGEQPLKDLMKTPPFSPFYDFVHFDGLDERGIDVALIYNTLEIQVLHSETMTYIFEIPDDNSENYDTTRDILYCKVMYQEKILHVYVLHLPSKRERDINKPKRDYILQELKKNIETRVHEEEGGVIVLGDFNTNPDDEGIVDLLNVSDETNLLNPFLNIYRNRVYSTFHYSHGLLFDQILVSGDLFKEESPLRFEYAEVFTSEKIKSTDKRFRGRPFRTYAGTRYLGGYSDHFPVIVKMEVNAP